MVEKEKNKVTKAKYENSETELSEEDLQLKSELDLIVSRLEENSDELNGPALESLRSMVRASTTSMTSVPKPLKFMRPHFDTMKKIHSNMSVGRTRNFCADIISVLSMTMSDKRECLKYRLLGLNEDIGDWGHEYVRHLAGEVSLEWVEMSEEESRAPLLALIRLLVAYLMSHNAEAEACDLLMEIEQLELIHEYVTSDSYQRVCIYLISCVPFIPNPENVITLRVALDIYRRYDEYTMGMRLALQLQDKPLVEQLLVTCKDSSIQKQLAFILARQNVSLNLDETEYAELLDIINNTDLNNHFLSLARELDILEPKSPEDIYKSHLENVRPTFGGNIDSARQNLASSFVNGFVNAGFGVDKLMCEEGNKWLYKNKEHGIFSAMASFGLVVLWDVGGGLTQLDRYLYSNDDYVKAGALLACGIVNATVRTECDPALALLSDYLLSGNNVTRVGAVLGLGLAYAGSARSDVLATIFQTLQDPKSSKEVVAVAALSCALIAVGSGDPETSRILLQIIMDHSSSESVRDPYIKFLPLSLALLYLGKQDESDVIACALEVCEEPLRSLAITMLEVCAFACTGNVLKIQKMLHICSEHFEQAKIGSEKRDEKKASTKEQKCDMSAQQSVAVLGLALIAMGEDVGSEMILRLFGHLLRYCEPSIRRAVPLAFALLSVSNPKMSVLDTLTKFSHDSDPEVAHNAIFAMGLVGAGTNNARLAANLRQLAQFYQRDANNLFLVRIAQGLAHMGKGTLSLSPWHSDRQLLSPVALAGLVATLMAFLDVKSLILNKSHYLLFCLTVAIQPRMLVTFDEELKSLPVSVRVGQAVDVVGQAGKPKTITGFQTHTTPVLLAHGERAELVSDEYEALSSCLEGFVILRKKQTTSA